MMKWMMSLSLAVFILFVAAGAGAVTPQPALPAETLSGIKLTVPYDLPHKPIVFVIGFSKGSDTQTRAWSEALKGALSADTTLVYSVAVIEDVPRLLRGFVTGSIRKSVPADLHDRFLVVSQRAPAWQAMAAYKVPDNAYLVLMNVARKIVWRVSGAVTADKLQTLLDALK